MIRRPRSRRCPIDPPARLTPTVPLAPKLLWERVPIHGDDPMGTRTTLAAAALLAAGALLGWLAGSGRLSLNSPAGPSAVAAQVQPAKEPARGDPSARDGRKPNIVFV